MCVDAKTWRQNIRIKKILNMERKKQQRDFAPQFPVSAVDIDEKFQQAVAFHQAGQLAQAERMCKQILRYNSQNAEAFHFLGIIACQTGKFPVAVDLIIHAIDIDSKQSSFYYSLANALRKQGKFMEAIEAYQKAIRIQPNYVDAYNNLGVVLIDHEKLEESVQIYQKTLEIQPNYADAYNNLGNALREQGKLEESIRIFQKAIYIQPNYAEAHNNLAMTLLLKGDFKNGWKQYEWRRQCDNFAFEKRDFPQPFWEGTDPKDKSILVWTEQGIGDEIMFSSILPDLLNRNASVIVESDTRMVSLFQRSFPKIRFIPRQNPPNSQLLNTTVDYQTPIGSLGKWFRTDKNSFILNRNTYLRACPKKTSEIRKKYQELAKEKILIGISWKSTGINQRQTYSKKKKSTLLEHWQPVLAQRNYYFINLQYGNVKQELNEFQKHNNLKIHQDDEIDSLNSLDDFAAQISALDLVISTSNTTVHLAGALGKQVWTLLPHIPDWRWTLEREDTLWYPKMRLFRQHRIGDWSDVFQQVKLALEQYPTNKNTNVLI